ncbi:MAG: WecB/TagA/CpsF family glycosyltransferase [Micropruina sp.]|uniref:WecB/TagA/CpsF family glycosyltransferase n=1 Tax=Micropruina sp. TaxID=2737536 RepID=UPI0039E45492
MNNVHTPLTDAPRRLFAGAAKVAPEMIVSSVPTQLLTAGDALDLIEAHWASDQDQPLGVASINLDHIHHFGEKGAWHGSLGKSMPWLNLIDGAPIAKKARRLTGTPWPRLAGSDLMGPILDRAQAGGIRVGFLGGAAPTLMKLRETAAVEWPHLTIAGTWAPPRQQIVDPAASRELAAEVREANVDLLVVCLGKPRQEAWIEANGAATGARVLLAFGAVVDFLAGEVSRAPQVIAEAGLEWAWRLAQEPSRLARRYLVQGPPAYLQLQRATLGGSFGHE